MVRDFGMCVTEKILVDIRHLLLSIVVVDMQVAIQRKKRIRKLIFVIPSIPQEREDFLFLVNDPVLKKLKQPEHEKATFSLSVIPFVFHSFPGRTNGNCNVMLKRRRKEGRIK